MDDEVHIGLYMVITDAAICRCQADARHNALRIIGLYITQLTIHWQYL